ncbi:NADP oxidoreductase [Massilia sp. Root351]|nr:NAD(P)-binding domain-containing protein [Massilia sp. Root351]KQV89896.1 NADP oxidoreductase [Massilia sp. Root351]
MSTPTTIGIIGAGAIGQAFAKQLVRAGINVILSNSRGPASLADTVKQLGGLARAGTVQQAAEADVVFLSVGWGAAESVLRGLNLDGRILIDATNPVLMPGLRKAELGGRTSTHVLSGWAKGARVVKAYNTLLSQVLASDPEEGGGRRVVWVSGNDAEAKAVVLQLTERIRFAGIDLGGLDVGGALQQFPGGVLPAINLVQLG